MKVLKNKLLRYINKGEKTGVEIYKNFGYDSQVIMALVELKHEGKIRRYKDIYSPSKPNLKWMY